MGYTDPMSNWETLTTGPKTVLPGPSADPAWAAEQARRQEVIRQAYYDYLGRNEVDAGGLAHWMDQANQLNNYDKLRAAIKYAAPDHGKASDLSAEALADPTYAGWFRGMQLDESQSQSALAAARDRALRQTHDFQTARLVEQQHDFDVPGDHAGDRVGHERALAGQGQLQSAVHQGGAGLGARRFDLAADAVHVPGKGAEAVGVHLGHMHHTAAGGGFEHRGDDRLLAMQRGQCDRVMPVAGVHWLHAQAQRATSV